MYYIYGISGPSLLIESTDSMIILCVCTATQKASVGMYSGCDTLSLQILFVYFLALPSLLYLSILLNCFYTCYCSFLVPSG